MLFHMHEHAYIYRYIRMSEYIEYKVDTFGLQKHLLESVKKTYTQKKSISRNRGRKKNYTQNISCYPFCIKKMSFSGSPKGTPHDWCRRTMKKIFCNENQWNWVVILKKLMNMFTGDLYSMYVVLQGIGCLTLSYMYKGKISYT